MSGTKLEQAARQARIALQKCAHALGSYSHSDFRQRMGGIKEAESAMQSLDAVLAEQAEPTVEDSLVVQEPVAWMYKKCGETRFAENKNTPGMHVTDSIPLYAATVQPVKQEPVAWVDLTGAEIGEVWAKHPRDFDKCVAIIEKFKDKNTNPVHTKEKPVAWMCSSPRLLGIGYSRFSECCAGVWNIPVYAAHVRTKDLTDDEIAMCMGKDLWNVYKNEVDFARAVIAAYKAKQK